MSRCDSHAKGAGARQVQGEFHPIPGGSEQAPEGGPATALGVQRA